MACWRQRSADGIFFHRRARYAPMMPLTPLDPCAAGLRCGRLLRCARRMLARGAGRSPARPARPLPALPTVGPVAGSPPPAWPRIAAGCARPDAAGAARRWPSCAGCTIDELLRDHPRELEADPAGEPVRARRTAAAVAVCRPARGRAGARLPRAARAGPRRPRAAALVLRRAARPVGHRRRWPGCAALDPALDADFNHVYTAQRRDCVARLARRQRGVDARGAGAAAPTPHRPGRRRRRPAASGAARGAPIGSWGCAGRAVPSAHGTAVASLLVGRDAAFAGAVPGATLYRRRRLLRRASGGSVEAVARGAGLAGARTGRRSSTSAWSGRRTGCSSAASRALVARGHLVVAAVGNDGPAAPPLYPAAYPGRRRRHRRRCPAAPDLPRPRTAPQVDVRRAGRRPGRCGEPRPRRLRRGARHLVRRAAGRRPARGPADSARPAAARSARSPALVGAADRPRRRRAAIRSSAADWSARTSPPIWPDCTRLRADPVAPRRRIATRRKDRDRFASARRCRR